MVVKQAEVVVVIKKQMMRYIIILILFLSAGLLNAQEQSDNKSGTYKKRVLESTEIDLLVSYYQQEGENAATTGGRGTEELNDISPSIIIAIPLNEDDILNITANISAYTSASSSNIDPFDGDGPADPFVASSGASQGDTWFNAIAGYSHSSDDRNRIWSSHLSFANEFDYTSFGLGGGYTMLFNEKNTELSLNGNIYIDSWKLLYPVELRPYANNGADKSLFNQKSTNLNYTPAFTEISKSGRNSYSFGLGFSQILSKRLIAYLAMDVIRQDGLLSTPFHRIYFKDFDDTFIENFHLADDIERLPGNRTKYAIGGRLNYYLSEYFVIRTFYRYYSDDWGISSHTMEIEIPIKINDKFTVYPSYRYYNQTASDYFAGYNEHLSTEKYYTSDYDLSEFHSNNYGIGISYTDVFTSMHISLLRLKSIDLKFNKYDRNSSFSASMVSFGVKFVIE